jgi:lipopolysaccharide/colanic/teichoic acid biosynthesis glycosyltransferase
MTPSPVTTPDSGAGDFFKRAMDFVVSLVAVILVSPVLIVMALLVKLTSPGPAFYRGVRVGQYGKTFRIFKFRTMVIDAEKRGGSATAEDDDRITPIGRFIRRHKLDEFPQFLNVLTGDMSLVGPRPESPIGLPSGIPMKQRFWRAAKTLKRLTKN